mmetsp:Transcript_75678/g.202560  ORF Transcript_75678/g.202560 Transcript_75678/m.202560 type:complete len:419 (+) Transcript_75678:1-1257(+)
MLPEFVVLLLSIVSVSMCVPIRDPSGDCLFAECELNSTQIIALYGYIPEEHICRTPDGYHLTLHRITTNSTPPFSKGPTLLLLHGLLDSSSTFLLNGRNSSLAFLLADQGFDIWLGNSRGNRYSLGHDFLSPRDVRFWNWSWDALARYDLPSMIDCVSKLSGAGSISLVGHSQGTMQTFAAMASPDFPERIGSKLLSFVALAPVAYLSDISSELLRALALIRAEELVELLGKGSFLPSTDMMRKLLPAACKADPAACQSMACLISGCRGEHSEHVDVARWPVYAAHYPSGTSVLNMVQLAQGMRAPGRFARFDYGSAEANLRAYNSTVPPEYPLALSASLPVLLLSGTLDALADPQDVLLLYQALGPPLGANLSWRTLDGWDHLDFIWAGKLAPGLALLIRQHVLSAAAAAAADAASH